MSDTLQGAYAKYLPKDYGYPLRTPEPSPTLPEDTYQKDGLQIGDLGFVDSDGRFNVLFNICKGPSNALHARHGVPDLFEPIAFDSEKDLDVNLTALPPGRVISSGVDQEVHPRERYEFATSSTSGAILILPSGAACHDLKMKEDFRKVAMLRALDWYEFATKHYGETVGHDSLYLITGFHKTTSWSLASFRNAPRTGRILVNHDNGIYSWVCSFNVDWRGHSRDEDNRPQTNQTIFLRGFRIAVRWRRWAIVEWVPSSQNPWIGQFFAFLSLVASLILLSLRWLPHVISRSKTEHVPFLSQPFHPSTAINRYLLDKNPNAQVAITHDSEWITMLEEEELVGDDLVQEDRLREILMDKYTWVSRDNAVYLRSKSDPGAIIEGPDDPGHDLEGFFLPPPLLESPHIVITRIRVDNVVAGLRRIPVGFYILTQFEGTTKRTKNKLLLLHENVIEWEDEIHLPLDLSAKVRFTLRACFELDPMLGNGETLYTSEIVVKDLVGSTFLITFSENPDPFPSLLLTLERRHINQFSFLAPKDTNVFWENSSYLAELTDEGHDALQRYHQDHKRDDLENAVGHFKRALGNCPPEHECRAAALFNLATANFILCQVDGPPSTVDAVISLYRKALEFRGASHPDRPMTILHLAQALLYRYKSYKNQQSTESDATEIREVVLEIQRTCPENRHELRAAGLVAQTCKVYEAINSGSLADLNELIPQLEQATQLPPEDYFDRYRRLDNYSAALSRRFELHGDINDLDRSIEINEQILRLFPRGSCDSVGFLASLCSSLRKRFEQVDHIADLDRLIAANRDVVQLLLDVHLDKPRMLINLGAALFRRFERAGNRVDLNESIAVMEEAERLTVPVHPDRPTILARLGVLLHARFEKFGSTTAENEENPREEKDRRPLIYSEATCDPDVILHESIRMARDYNSSQLLWNDDSATLRHTANFSEKFVDSPEAVIESDSEEISEDLLQLYSQLRQTSIHPSPPSIQYEKHIHLSSESSSEADAEQDLPDPRFQDDRDVEHPGIPTAPSLHESFERVGDDADLNRSIFSLTNALSLTMIGHPDRPGMLTSLGNVLRMRFEELGNFSDLAKSISSLKAALRTIPSSDSDRSRTLAILGTSFLRLFERSGMTVHIEKSISLIEEAIQLTPIEDAALPGILASLGISLRVCFEEVGRIENLHKSISTLQEALRLSPAGHPDRPRILASLGSSLRVYSGGLDDLQVDSLSQSISAINEAIELTPEGNPDLPDMLSSLSRSLRERYEKFSDPNDLAEANRLMQEAEESGGSRYCFSRL